MPPSITLSINGVEWVLARLSASRYRRVMRNAMTAATVFGLGQLRQRIPVRSGQTRGRMTYRVVEQHNELIGEIGGKSISRSGFNILKGLEEGTGIYGPNKQMIRPVNASVLRFTVGGAPVSGRGGNVVFARHVRGMKPRRPFALTKKEAGSQIQAVFVSRFLQEWDT